MRPSSKYALHLNRDGMIELQDTAELASLESLSAEMWVSTDIGTREALLNNMTLESATTQRGGWAAMWGFHVTKKAGEKDFMPAYSSAVDSSVITIPMAGEYGNGRPVGSWAHYLLIRNGDTVQIAIHGYRWYQGEWKRERCVNGTINLRLGLGPDYKKHFKLFAPKGYNLAAFRLSSGTRYTLTGDGQDFEPPREFTLDAQTLILLDFSRDTGDEIRDLSGHNHHGTIVGGKWELLP